MAIVIGSLAPLRTGKSYLYINISGRKRHSCFNILLLIYQLTFIEQLFCVSEVNGRPLVIHCKIGSQMLVGDRYYLTNGFTTIFFIGNDFFDIFNANLTSNNMITFIALHNLIILKNFKVYIYK